MTPDEMSEAFALADHNIADIAEVSGALDEVLPRSVFGIWLVTPHPGLKGETPADVILRGEKQTVLNLIDAMAEGVFM